MSAKLLSVKWEQREPVLTVDQGVGAPTALFPDVKQCPNKPTEYIFHDPYCKACADALRVIHEQLNRPA